MRLHSKARSTRTGVVAAVLAYAQIRICVSKLHERKPWPPHHEVWRRQWHRAATCALGVHDVVFTPVTNHDRWLVRMAEDDDCRDICTSASGKQAKFEEPQMKLSWGPEVRL